MSTKIETIALNESDLEAVNGGVDWARKIQGASELGRGLMAAAEAKAVQKILPGFGTALGKAHMEFNARPNIDSGWDKLTS